MRQAAATSAPGCPSGRREGPAGQRAAKTEVATVVRRQVQRSPLGGGGGFPRNPRPARASLDSLIAKRGVLRTGICLIAAHLFARGPGPPVVGTPGYGRH